MKSINIILPDGEHLAVTLSDESTHHQELQVDETVTLRFLYPTFVDIPIHSYIEWGGMRYKLSNPATYVKTSTYHYDYTLTFTAPFHDTKKYVLRSPVENLIKFDVYFTPKQFLDFVVAQLNARPNESGWEVGTYIDAPAKTLSFNLTYIYDAVGTAAGEFETEYFVQGKTLHFGKVVFNETAPLQLAYGKELGLLPGIERFNSDDSDPFELLIVQGGERNIDPSIYGSNSLLLPKSQEITVGDKTYVSDATGLYITEKGQVYSTYQEACLDCTQIYPMREGTVAEFITVDVEKHNYDFTDTTIPEDLDFKQHFIVGETPTIIFQSGMLAGREFDIADYIHAERKFQLVAAEIDGRWMPDIASGFVAVAGDSYAVFNIALPDAYLCDNTTQTGASWEMFQEAARYMYENSVPRFTYQAKLWGAWAAKDWVNIGGKIVLGGMVNLTDPQFLPASGVDIRIVSITTTLTNPYQPEIVLSNTPVAPSFISKIEDLENTEVKVDGNIKNLRLLAKRGFRDASETSELLQNALLHYTTEINPIVVNTMQVVVGDATLQYRFVDSTVNPSPLPHVILFNKETLRLESPAGIIQHMTLGISSIAPAHNVNEYRFWNVSSYTSATLIEPDTRYFLYIKASKQNQTATMLLSTSAIAMEEVDGYYHFLTGILNSEYEGDRSFAPLYGYTEVLPGQVLTDKIVSSAGTSFFDLLNEAFQLGDKLDFNIDGNGKLRLNGVEFVINGEETTLEDVIEQSQDDISKSLGYPSGYAELVEAYERGQTIIKGGYINTGLLQAEEVVAAIIATNLLIVRRLQTNNEAGKPKIIIDDATNSIQALDAENSAAFLLTGEDIAGLSDVIGNFPPVEYPVSDLSLGSTFAINQPINATVIDDSGFSITSSKQGALSLPGAVLRTRISAVPTDGITVAARIFFQEWVNDVWQNREVLLSTILSLTTTEQVSLAIPAIATTATQGDYRLRGEITYEGGVNDSGVGISATTTVEWAGDISFVVSNKLIRIARNAFVYGVSNSKYMMLIDKVGERFVNIQGDGQWRSPDGDSFIEVTDEGVKITGLSGEISANIPWDNVTGKPTFADVATSGSYNDLKDKPVLTKGAVEAVLTGSIQSHSHPISKVDGLQSELTDIDQAILANTTAIQAMQGGALYIGVIYKTTDEIENPPVGTTTNEVLAARAIEIRGDVKKGYSLKDLSESEWWCEGVTADGDSYWNFMGQSRVGTATNSTQGVVQGSGDTDKVGVNALGQMVLNLVSTAKLIGNLSISRITGWFTRNLRIGGTDYSFMSSVNGNTVDVDELITDSINQNATTIVQTHNSSEDAHKDIRAELSSVTELSSNGLLWIGLVQQYSPAVTDSALNAILQNWVSEINEPRANLVITDLDGSMWRTKSIVGFNPVTADWEWTSRVSESAITAASSTFSSYVTYLNPVGMTVAQAKEALKAVLATNSEKPNFHIDVRSGNLLAEHWSNDSYVIPTSNVRNTYRVTTNIGNYARIEVLLYSGSTIFTAVLLADVWQPMYELATTQSTVANANNLGGVSASNYLQKSGGIMTGTLTMGSNWITGVGGSGLIRMTDSYNTEIGDTLAGKWTNIRSGDLRIGMQQALHAGNVGNYNAGSATKLQTPKTLWGVPFDGTSNVIDPPTFGTGGTINSDWYRSSGVVGWYSNTYSGGIYMTDSLDVRVYNGKNFRTDGVLKGYQGVQIGSVSDYGWYKNSEGAICAGGGTARRVNTGGLLVSNAWADGGNVPSNGIYSKGVVSTPASFYSINRRYHSYGIYDYTKTQGIWSMGSSYGCDSDGSGFGNMYGLAYKYGSYAGGHQVIHCINGVPKVAMGENLWVASYAYAEDFLAFSDERLKENINEIKPKDTSISIVAKRFNFKEQKDYKAGYIAQEVQKVYPEYVHTDSNGMLSVQYTSIHTEKIAYLEVENKMLKQRLDKLEKITNKI